MPSAPKQYTGEGEGEALRHAVLLATSKFWPANPTPVLFQNGAFMDRGRGGTNHWTWPWAENQLVCCFSNISLAVLKHLKCIVRDSHVKQVLHTQDTRALTFAEFVTSLVVCFLPSLCTKVDWAGKHLPGCKARLGSLAPSGYHWQTYGKSGLKASRERVKSNCAASCPLRADS